MALNWCEGLKPSDGFLHLRYYARFLHCGYLLQLFVNLKVTNKQNTICSRTHKSHFIDFPVCNPQSQSAISFPGKMGRGLWPGYCNIVSGCILYPTFNSFSTFFPVFCDPGQENVCRSQRARWGSGNIVSLEIGSS